MTDSQDQVEQQVEEALQTYSPAWCLQMTRSPWLDYVFTLMALLSCLTLCMYHPSNIELLEVFVFIFFVVEMVIKMAALGVYGSSGSYLGNNWNKFDVIINIGEMLYFCLASLGFHVEIGKVLGPFRLIGRVPCMRNLVTGLLDILPLLENILILCIIIIHLFALMGVQLWAGKLRNRCFLGADVPSMYNVQLSPYYLSNFPFICSLDDGNGMQRCRDVPPYITNGTTCSLAPPQHNSGANGFVPTEAGASDQLCVNWNMHYNVCRAGDHNPYMDAISFDNIGFASIAIFQVITLEGWSDIMSLVMDAHSFWNFVFFMFVTVMGSFIMMNVCAVMITTQFSQTVPTGRPEQRSATENLKRLCSWLIPRLRRMSSICTRRRNRVASSGSRNLSVTNEVWITLRTKVVQAVKSDLFKRLIVLTVLLSVVAMVVEHHEQPKVLTRVLRISNISFTIVFFVEMALKLVAFSWRYFAHLNNIFDFVMVIISLCELRAKAEGRLSVLRAFRLLRFVKLLRKLPYLTKQLEMLRKTVAGAVGLFSLLLFTTLIFSMLGTQLFGGQLTQDQNYPDRKNFDSPLWSMVTVFQILTMEDWNLVLYKAMAATSPWSALYFIGLIMLGKYVLLNILVAIVVQRFQNRHTSVSPCEPSNSTQINTGPEEEHDHITEDNGVLRWCKVHEDWSFYVFSPQNRFRVFCRRLISYNMFDHMILVVILLNCITIAMERPGIDPESMERQFLKVCGYLFSVVFMLEMFFKVVALGLVVGKDSYLRTPWNIIDGSLVILSLVHIVVRLVSAGNSNTLGILKVLRLLRTLRPLRVVKRAPRLKLALEALIASVKPIGNIIFICFAFLFFFGLLGVQLFKGKFHHCVGKDTRNITDKSDCLSSNSRWVRKVYNFDSLPQAMMTLFVMYSKDGWVNIMYDGLNAVGVDKQPVANYNAWMLLFFIPFMISSFVLLDMFIGIMVENYHQCQQEQRTRDEKTLEETGEVVQDQSMDSEQMPYYKSYSPLRHSIHALCTNKFTEIFMTVVTFLSIFIMSCEHYNQPQYIRDLTVYYHYVFTIILTTEVLLKVVAFGILRFLKIGWNLLDLFVMLVSIIGIVSKEIAGATVIPFSPSILRVLSLVQVLKAKWMLLLLRTIIKSLSQVGNIGLLFMFVFFIYAALGVELFGKLECTDDYPCLGLRRHANFSHFGMALLTLYQVCTGDNWSAIMKDTLRECRPGYDDCLTFLSWVSPIYFISFVVIAQFILVNLLVAAIMQALEDCTEVSTNSENDSQHQPL